MSMVSSNPEQTERRVKQLEALYDSFYSEQNRCIYYSDCSEGQHTNGFMFSRAASVGGNYDLCVDRKPIRIIFVGKEGRNGNDDVHPTTRLSEFSGRVNQHYQESYKMLCEMLRYNWEARGLKENNRFRDKPDANLTCFALTNLYRCAFKKERSQVKYVPNIERQREHCSEILRAELRILQPTVLVLQKADLKAVNIFPDAIRHGDHESVWYSTAANVFVIETSHPHNRNKNRGWYNYYKPRFTDAVNYLASIGALPEIGADLTNEIDKLDDKKRLEDGRAV